MLVNRKMKKGFTLIELLVVITIIGLLAGGIVISLSHAQKRGRDTQRIADINSVAQAMSAYYADIHAYPPAVGATSEERYINLDNAPPAGLVSTYLRVLPQKDNTTYRFQYGAWGGTPCCANYTLVVNTELNIEQPTGSPRTGYRITNGEQVRSW